MYGLLTIASQELRWEERYDLGCATGSLNTPH